MYALFGFDLAIFSVWSKAAFRS